ncbi:MAG: acyl carrier protein [Oscillospiraceae bacterium]|nr:acyl carrier protein [Oscillospiraceae bacterium]MBQ7980105.1 acyl carrier protein [Oscillospiraceae bacterium]
MTIDTVKNIIAEQLDLDADDITMQSSIMEDLGADSLDVVEILIAFEDEFDVKLPEEEVEKLKTVGDIVKYIEDRMAD